MGTEHYDLAILGGGPAGLSAALVAGRARLRTAIINDEKPRNRVTKASHGFFTRDGAHALDLLKHGKAGLERYGSVEYIVDQAIHVAKDGDGFLVQRANRSDITARRVVIATGHRDDLDAPGIPNLREVYGTSVFPCPFCDGYEHRDERLAIIGTVGLEHLVPMTRVWSHDIHVFTNGTGLDDGTRQALERNEIPVEEAPIHELIHENGRLRAVRIGDRLIDRDAGFVAGPFSHPSTSFADALGVPRAKHPWGLTTYEADEFGRTDLAGVYVVGDAHHGFARLLASATEGARCAEMIVSETAMEAWK